MTARVIKQTTLLATLGLALGISGVAAEQERGAPVPSPSVLRPGSGQTVSGVEPSAKETAPVDLGGYWVSVVNKEWRFRMVIPAKGDFFGVIGGIPINAEARRVAEAWDPAKDEASGEACRAYGAAGLMRIPGRLHVTWQDDNTLRVDTDAGRQTRLFHFAPPQRRAAPTPPQGQGRPEQARGASLSRRAAPPPRGRPTWQGYSVARWILPTGAARGREGGALEGAGGPRNGSLEVVTTNLRPGYLRRNGVPYSAATAMTEYWDLFKEPDGTDWLIITTTIVDPTYLQMPYETSPAFKREPDGSKWDPSPCSARW
jgi:hypothetical protein